MAASVVSYLLRGIPADVWRRVKAKAAADGISVRALLLQWLEEYAR
jgi:hypothetical protein